MTMSAVELRDPVGGLEATFLPELGMVGSSLRHDGEELLAQRDGPDAYRDHKATFGIPFLHPWANRLSAWEYSVGETEVSLDHSSPVLKADGDTGLPIHGALAASPYWEVVEAGDGRLRARLDYGAHPELLAVFPFPHRVSMEVRLAERRLSVQVTVTPTGERAVPISFGFHPYIALPGSQRDEWQVQLPVLRRAVLDEHQIPTGREDELEPGALSGPLGQRVFDDSFPALTGSPPEFSVADSRRRVSVQFTRGYPVAQVYAPAGAAFIAFEPMTAPVDALRSGTGLRFAEPGEEFSAEFAIAVDAV